MLFVLASFVLFRAADFATAASMLASLVGVHGWGGSFGEPGLIVIAALYFWTDVSRVLLFWAAFILTRPLGATVGDFLDKPVNQGGLALSRPLASAVLAVFILACVLLLPQRAGAHPGSTEPLIERR